MKHDVERVTDAEAARVWERAVEAALAAEAVAAKPGVTIDAPASPTGGGSGGYALSHVRTAALEAGIAPEFVEAAVAEMRIERALPLSPASGALARRVLRHPPEMLIARRRIAATAHEVLEAMDALFVHEPYRLVVVDQAGDPLTGGVMVFDIHSATSLLNQSFGYHMQDAGVKQLAITVQSHPGPSPECVVTVCGRVTSFKVATGLGLMLSSLGGVAGAVAGLAMGVAVAGLGVATGVVPALAIGGAAVGGAGGLKGFRVAHRRSMQNGTRALEGLLGAIAARAGGGQLGLNK